MNNLKSKKMAICNGCGGVIGRDCFNPIECESISQQYTNEELERQVEILTKLLIENSIPVPDFSEKSEVTTEATNDRKRDPFNNEPLPF